MKRYTPRTTQDDPISVMMVERADGPYVRYGDHADSDINRDDAKYLVELINASRTVTDPDGDTYGRQIGEEAEQVYAKLKLIAAGPRLPCEKPPAGWKCSRVRGHAGPCAATEVTNEQ